MIQRQRAPDRLAIRRFLEEAHFDRPSIDRFLHSHTFPLVEGPSVTFVYRGEADAVYLRHWVYGLTSSQSLTRVPDTDLWHIIIELPENSRVEYKYELVRSGHRELVQDPLNPHRAHDPFGSNSVCHSRGYHVPEWTRRDAEAREGALEGFAMESRFLGRVAHVTLYRPARFRRTRRYPLLVVHDGSDFLRYSGMKVVLDNLIHRLEIPDMLVAFSDSSDRLREYANHEGHGRYLVEELVPKLSQLLPVSEKPAERALMGASFGAVGALATAWRHPGFFGRLLLLSGSFAFTDIGRNHARGPIFDPVVEFVNTYRSDPTAVSERLFVGCGIYEPLIYENRSLVPLLQSTGMELRYVEARDGHNWENWRDRLREGLSYLFPGPLLLYYE
jgi:enterochelin esterase-like enzyme